MLDIFLVLHGSKDEDQYMVFTTHQRCIYLSLQKRTIQRIIFCYYLEQSYSALDSTSFPGSFPFPSRGKEPGNEDAVISDV
jgi:hypothetical protein